MQISIHAVLSYLLKLQVRDTLNGCTIIKLKFSLSGGKKIHLRKDVQDHYSENYKRFLRKNTEDLYKLRDISYLRIGKLNSIL